MKRKPLRRMSKKRAALLREIGPDRRAYMAEFPSCAFPGCGKRTMCVHEIAFGTAARRLAFGRAETWLPSCLDHNRSGEGFHNPTLMPIVAQCAVKKHVDPTRYDLAVICECRGRALTDITEQEVNETYERVYKQ